MSLIASHFSETSLAESMSNQNLPRFLTNKLIKNIPLITVLIHNTENEPTLIKKYQQIGLSRAGQKDLYRLIYSKPHKQRRFRDTFYNKSSMLYNEWNFVRQDLDTNELVSIVKTIITNQQDTQSFSKQSRDFTKTEKVVSYEVERLECDFGGYVIEMDETTFPQSDPHFTCTIQYKRETDQPQEIDLNGLSICSQNSKYPVRSKLAEYFFRHERQFYQELVSANIIPGCEYHISLTQKQVDEVNNRSNVSDIMEMIEGTFYDEHLVVDEDDPSFIGSIGEEDK